MKKCTWLLLLLIHISGQAQPATPDVLIAKIKKLRPDTPWTLVASVPLRFPTYHPQGMVKIGPDFYLSSVQVLQKPAEGSPGEGIGYLFKFDAEGKLLAQQTLGESTLYHPGGIDYDGRYLWVPVAEYRPRSRSVLYRVDPATLVAEEVLRHDDHLGGLVHHIDAHTLHGVSWGSRDFYQWSLNEPQKVPLRVPNPAFYIDYQDCHYLGNHLMLCGGLKNYPGPANAPAFRLGGLELVSLLDHRPVHQVPVPLWSPTGAPMTNNPFWVEATAHGLRGYFVPDDDAASTLYVYEAVIE
ncbi:DUF6454 family protein [Rhabdobacter roseus]|uniref:Uncharacterized protein n=1 Tax=Rhabdobacter roseus TaxID=1655419 RepID=A0A840U6D5_9BACT|nr:DUF6454 family protein [Rhabdobacter roseus]MBB5287610.1 hypothetical protein [Rhabdobacter roseus]